MTHPQWSPDQPIVSLKDVHKSFGSLKVLDGISLDVRKGAFAPNRRSSAASMP